MNFSPANRPNLFDVAQTNPEITSVLAKNGFPPNKLAEGAAAVAALVEARHLRAEAKIKRTEACLKRNGAFKVLAKWLHCALRTQADIEKAERHEMATGSILNPDN